METEEGKEENGVGIWTIGGREGLRRSLVRAGRRSQLREGNYGKREVEGRE